MGIGLYLYALESITIPNNCRLDNYALANNDSLTTIEMMGDDIDLGENVLFVSEEEGDRGFHDATAVEEREHVLEGESWVKRGTIKQRIG